ncbi:MAG: hypothetical protein ACRYG8_10340 [Janthinobacterium lividum]
MNALLPERPPSGLPASTRWRMPAALAVDVVALDGDGRVAWSWIARRWRGRDVVVALELAPEQWPPSSWRGYMSEAEVQRMRRMFGGILLEREVCRAGEDLDELLRRPWRALVVRVWPLGLL